MTYTHYAMIEDILFDGPDAMVILDCITASAAAQLRTRKWAQTQPEDQYLEQTMLLSVRLKDLMYAMRTDLKQIYDAPKSWISFDLQDSYPPFKEGSIGATFFSLGDQNQEASPSFAMANVQLASPQLQQLAFLGGLSVRQTQIFDTLEAAASQAGQSRWVVAYDVGQGNANALIDDNGHPCLFFDLGWPTRPNTRTRPSPRPALLAAESCCRRRFTAPVVLSHWDFDHWAYAVSNMNYSTKNRAANIRFDPNAVNRPWIIPRPPARLRGKGLGPTHLRFIAQLRQRLVWPNRLRRVAFSAGVITRTDPARDPHDRNNQGLAWFVMQNASHTLATLLPGDVEYSKLHWPTFTPELVSLVASHHGGWAGMPPAATKCTPAHLILSVGYDNVHSHPSAAAIGNHWIMGWPDPLLTSTRPTSPGSPLTNGSVLIPLDPSAPRPTFSCPTLIASQLVPTQ
ncbi:hypothetical protein [Pseudomonas rubra]|uniref:Uncharacterized protein n=1 Tax=Pseudomonas rubra TaxID=2942627 RepID=A0ABT5PAH3_9PSED|nr:hypothetical protein [Pseudomonas rubra]MDD1015033.1 hypothetical protein [Pseudomonas rubra]MDD1038632.1 hypothetical protein [Pseudomonas rubra]MDD1154676.1 hypothetical protein [Pseudomonas rubra]